MILYGASGHGKVIIDILESMHEPHIEIWDDAPAGPIWEYQVKKPDARINVMEKMVISIGLNNTRKKVVERLGAVISYGKAIHTSAVISKRAFIGDGTVVMAGVTINPDVKVGKHCIINTSASIDHDCVLEDYVHISPNATLSGDVFVGEGTHIGSGAVAIQGVKIGKWCRIGAGTVIIGDIPDFATAVGNPAKVIKINGKKL